MLGKAIRFSAGAGLLAFAVPGLAQTSWEYYFGTWLGDAPSYHPTETFAALSVSTIDHQSFDFTLRAYDPNGTGTLASAFSPTAYISKVAFNSVSGDNPIGISGIETNGYVASLSLGTGDGTLGGITFDFFDCVNNCTFVGNGATLQSGEWVSWTLNFATPQTPFLGAPPAAVNVHNWDPGGSLNSGWYTPSGATAPVPEPETFAMLLAGLGLMGFVARRRQRNLAAS